MQSSLTHRSFISAGSLFLSILVGACGLVPKFEVEQVSGPDMSGASKFAYPKSILTVKSVTRLEDNKPVVLLVASMTSAPSDKVYLLRPKNSFLQETQLNPVYENNSTVLKSLSVKTKDKLEDHIKTAATIAKAVVGLAAILALDQDASREKTKALEKFKPWAIDLKEDPGALSGTSGSVARNEGWTYSLKLSPPSKTSFTASPAVKKNLGDKGVMTFASCRQATLALTHSGLGMEYVFSEMVHDPTNLESVRLPSEGTVSFGICAASVAETSKVERNPLQLIATTLTEAKSILEAIEKAK